MGLNWKGDDVKRQVLDAAEEALEEVADLCVIDAKAKAPFEFGVLQGSIRREGVKGKGSDMSIRWGSYDVEYAIYQEVGTSRMSAQPFLRPAADKNYPKLTQRIKARVK